MQSNETQRTPQFPGNIPYREYGGVPFKPVANGKCTSCGLCVKECPTGAIPLDNPKMTDKAKCISCMHCVAICPKKARKCSKFVSFIAGRKMKKVCSGRKENRLYIFEGKGSQIWIYTIGRPFTCWWKDNSTLKKRWGIPDFSSDSSCIVRRSEVAFARGWDVSR